MGAGKKIAEPFGLITQRELAGLIARGADLAHIAMFVVLRVRADRDSITRDSVPTLASKVGRSHDTVERLLKWLRERGVLAQERVSSRKGQQHLTWLYERRALPIDEWMEYASVPPSPDDGVRTDAPSTTTTGYANGGDGVRKHESWSTQPLGDNPDVTQRESQAVPTLPSFLEERRDEVMGILAKSKHAKAFEGKRDALAVVLSRYPDKDAVQTAEAIAKLDEQIRNGPAFFATWLANADEIEPPEQYVCLEHEKVFADQCSAGCRGAYSPVGYHRPGGLYFEPDLWERIRARVHSG